MKPQVPPGSCFIQRAKSVEKPDWVNAQAIAVAQPMIEERFSEDELKAVIAFLESPASKKYREFGSQLPPALTEKLVAETRATVDPKLKTLEQTLQTKLRAAVGAPASAPAASAAPAAKPAAGAKK
mgnify:CR=1 FL=1